ncbi:TIGR04255 family protein [Persicitalea sp.]|uniref:TIGR04255 family protein n=1 Tax=Persicitalea sp. TaxID=3100273 RepID=UPI0035939174
MKLPKAPLKEVIFEIFWDVQITPEGLAIDSDFEFALGLFAKKIKASHSKDKKLYPNGAPLQLTGKVTHQFWRDEMTWPIVQLGPGVMTVNDTDITYDWENGYFDLVQNCLDYLFESYEYKININQLQLKYIDAVDLASDTDYVGFLKDHLRIELRNDFTLPGKAVGAHVNQGFQLEDGSLLTLFAGDAVNQSTKQTAAVWTTTVFKTGNFSQDEIVEWLSRAHDIASATFKEMVSPQFYKTFL